MFQAINEKQAALRSRKAAMFHLSILSMTCLASLALLTAIGSTQDGVDPSKGQGSAVEERELI
jgi:hypothetical protein